MQHRDNGEGEGEVSVPSVPDTVEKWVCVCCGVIDCGHHLCVLQSY